MILFAQVSASFCNSRHGMYGVIAFFRELPWIPDNFDGLSGEQAIVSGYDKGKTLGFGPVVSCGESIVDEI